MSGTLPGRTTVYHLGRAGDIPGGMTQVVNGYLEWPFAHVDVAVITSRGDPHDLRAAARHAVGALLRVLRVPRHGSVVVAHLSERGSFVREGLLLRIARLRGLGTVAHLHGSSFAAFSHRYPRLVRFALRSADRVISLSAESSDIAERFVPADRISLIPNAIPGSHPVPKQNVVVFGGIVSHRKGVDVLIAAWEQVAVPDGWRLVLAGPADDEQLVRRNIPNVEFRGTLPHNQLMQLLAIAKVAVLPSRAEAMPMFILEAMARSACVIATDVGGIGPVLADGRGLLIPAGDVAALAEALQTAMSDDAARARIAEAGFDSFTTSYSADAVFPRVEELWLEAAAAGGLLRR